MRETKRKPHRIETAIDSFCRRTSINPSQHIKSLMRIKARVDNNQAEIVKGLRELGYSVAHTHQVGGGVPDLFIGKYGITWPVEVKSKAGKLTSSERDFALSWNGTPVIVARCLTDILEITEKDAPCPVVRERRRGKERGREKAGKKGSS